MRYGNWIEAGSKELTIPKEAGLFQLRVAQCLLKYPKGRSAMFYYGYATNLQTGILQFEQNILPQLQTTSPLLLRWMVTDNTEAVFKKQMHRFQTKFGSLPAGNEVFLAGLNRKAKPRMT